MTCNATSGGTFPLGDTIVDCSATDTAGNTGHSLFTVTVEDTTAPVVAAHADIPVPATGPSGAIVTYTPPTATDLVGPLSPAVTCAPASGSLFPMGATPVDCSATDTAGNTGHSFFTVTVQDATAPVIAFHADVVTEATGPSGAVVNYIPPTATDDDPPSPAVTCAPLPGSTFPLGQTTVNCSATDNSANTGYSSFKVIVEDTTDPVVGTHIDVTVEATGPSGAVATFAAPSATDLVDPSLTVICSPASGTTFALGDTTVTCEAMDDSGNLGQSTFKVTVEDTTAPTVGTPWPRRDGRHRAVRARWTGHTPPAHRPGGPVCRLTVTCAPAPGRCSPSATPRSLPGYGRPREHRHGSFTVTVNPPPAFGLDLGSGSAYVTFGDPDKLGVSQFTLETWFKRTGAGPRPVPATAGLPPTRW